MPVIAKSYRCLYFDIFFLALRRVPWLEPGGHR